MVSLLVVAMRTSGPEAMVTLSLALTAGVLRRHRPAAGHLAGLQRPGAQRMMRPVLDAQTTPAFVYLVPVVMLFGIGNVPGVTVTIVFALPPGALLTNLSTAGCARR